MTRELLKARDFETLTTDYVVNKKGIRRPVSMSDAYYTQFAVKFTGSSCFNVAETSTLFRSVVYVARDYETLTTDYVVNKKGVRRSVSTSDAYYTQFAVKFTGSSCFNLAETSTLFRSGVYVARRFFATKGEIYDDGQVREFLMWLLKPSTSELFKYFPVPFCF